MERALRIGRPEEYDRALALKADDIRSLNARARLLRELGRLPEALREYEALVRLNPEDAESFRLIGHIRFLQGELDGAIDALKQAIGLRPDYPQLHYDLSLVYRKKGLEDEARQEYSVYRLKSFSFELSSEYAPE